MNLSIRTKRILITLLAVTALVGCVLLPVGNRGEVISVIALHVSLAAFVVALPTNAHIRIVGNVVYRVRKQDRLAFCVHNSGTVPGRIRLLKALVYPSGEEAAVQGHWCRIKGNETTDFEIAMSPNCEPQDLELHYQVAIGGKQSHVLTRTLQIEELN